MWNPKTELAKKAVEIARKEHPEGFNEDQLIDASKKVYDGFGVTQVNPLVTKPIRTMEDINNMGNAMAQIDGHYPVGMSGCEVVGINGGCGLDCPVYLEGDCKNGQEFEGDDMTDEERKAHFELYRESESPVPAENMKMLHEMHTEVLGDSLSNREIGYLQWIHKFAQHRSYNSITTCYLNAREWFKKHGFTRIQTGGNCEAWSLLVGDIQILVTDCDCSIPVFPDEQCYVGSFDFKGDQLGTEQMYFQDFLDLWGD